MLGVGVAHRGVESGGLVEQDHHRLGGPGGEQFAVHLHAVRGGIHLDPHLPDDRAVDLDAALEDQFLGSTAGIHAPVGQYFLQPFKRHRHPGGNCGAGFGGRLQRSALFAFRAPRQLLDLPQRGQIVQGGQAEYLEKFSGGAVEDRAAGNVLLAHHADEPPVEERTDHRSAVHAAHLFGFGAGDGLAVGDDGQRFERGLRELRPGGRPPCGPGWAEAPGSCASGSRRPPR